MMKSNSNKIMLILCILVMPNLILAANVEYKNNWVKYGDDKETSYYVDTNSINRNDIGNFYVLIKIVPYSNNLFNKRFNRKDIVYLYSEIEIDWVNSFERNLSIRAYNNKGEEILSDSFSLKEGDVPPFNKIIPGSVADSLKKYIVDRLQL